MPFEFEKAELEGLFVIRPKVFPDDRGFFLESYKASDFQKARIDVVFVQDNHSSSTRGVLRGLHYQLPPHAQGKLVRVLEGRVWDVAVDIRPESPTFGRWFGIELSAVDHLMFYIPPGFAHGFVTLSETAQFFYKCTAEYDKESEAGIRWDDPQIAVKWPLNDVHVSDRDRGLPLLFAARVFPKGWLKSIWLTGSRGMLGQDVARELDSHGLQHVDTDMDCDITSPYVIEQFADGKTIDWIVNCSAYTAVDKSEDEEDAADRVNALGPENLGRLAASIGARIVHISTDYVFDGKGTSPYREDHPVAPTGAYGRTKARGERLLAEAASSHFILRTAWLYGVHGKNFVYTMLRLMNEKDEVTVVSDQHGSPTYTRDLASVVGTLIARDSHAFGTFHYTNEGETSWYEFARAIYETGRSEGRIARSCNVRPISTDQYSTKTARPKYSVLSKEKIKKTLGISVPSWQDGLERFFAELKEEAK